MFNKKSIGKRVVSTALGKGTVVEVNMSRHYPVAVQWDLGSEIPDGQTLFTLQGLYIAGRATPDKDITLLYTKQGTPEARRIVAMLAREYRSEKHACPDDGEEDYRAGRRDILEDVYQQAKHLLGESK